MAVVVGQHGGEQRMTAAFIIANTERNWDGRITEAAGGARQSLLNYQQSRYEFAAGDSTIAEADVRG